VDFNGARALVSTCHTDAVIEQTVAAFETAVRAMREEGLA
jgi:glutamate-1-semialdehyde aminotransferase